MNQSLDELGGRDLDDGGDAAHIIHLTEELGLSIDSLKTKTYSYYYDTQNGKSYDVYKELMVNFPEITEKTVKQLKLIQSHSKNLEEVLKSFFSKSPVLRRYFDARMRSYEGTETVHLSPVYATGSFLDILKDTVESQKAAKNGKPVIYSSKKIRNWSGLF